MYTEKSFVLKPADADKKWHLIDATDMVVGRLATEIANVLRGKNSPKYTPHTDSGDFVVVINAEKVRFTGNKWNDKVYYRHTGYAGGLKERTAKEQLERKPEAILMSAVKGMLPKNSLGRKQLTKLKVFAGSEHAHEAQKPVEYKF
ncbi:50S ribosomal protein L13 [Halobacteriovorax sp. XZX-3]|uniref:50S ribosomal protein L13 n=1 Tax=unclassified Halobacteriovorax TaxID=2639665 RepID=UPI000CD13FB8|nr:50S ribosomal protein L13 [Halobacteriovorax sp. DA5]POB13072.1 50S ribosomal protein L13 [Halobacteriovorax sp. DA5]